MMKELPKATKPPGKAIKISWWDRLQNWYWNWRYPFKTIELPDPVFDWPGKDKQEAVDRIYNQMKDKMALTVMPPMSMKLESPVYKQIKLPSLNVGFDSAVPGSEVEVRRRVDRPEGCHTANGLLFCYCGKCVPEDYLFPKDLI